MHMLWNNTQHTNTQSFLLATRRKADLSVINLGFSIEREPDFLLMFRLVSCSNSSKTGCFMSMLLSDTLNGLKVQLLLWVAAISPRLSLRHHQSGVFTALKSPICYCCSPIRPIKTWLKKRFAVRDKCLDTQSRPRVLLLSITAAVFFTLFTLKWLSSESHRAHF